jgi:hypothetical protein
LSQIPHRSQRARNATIQSGKARTGSEPSRLCTPARAKWAWCFTPNKCVNGASLPSWCRAAPSATKCFRNHSRSRNYASHA